MNVVSRATKNVKMASFNDDLVHILSTQVGRSSAQCLPSTSRECPHPGSHSTTSRHEPLACISDAENTLQTHTHAPKITRRKQSLI